MKNNINKEEMNDFKNIQYNEMRSYRIQDKWTRFLILDNHIIY